MPRIDDILDSLAGRNNYLPLDLASGYWKWKPKDSKKTAFITKSIVPIKVLLFRPLVHSAINGCGA
uniref:Retrovirus-related pol polyprotein from transposon n=1 Tax=Triatoma infestans TaxID=30076 RepID=A0A170YQF1_TRIIF